jgi:F0F1-type ATP synthase membrane subunit b/b'
VNDEVLQRLLEVEKEAASIVEDAQKKAGDALSENDRRERLAYNDRYKEAVAALDLAREKELADITRLYKEELALYQNELDARVLDYEAFNGVFSAALFQKDGEGGV